MLNFIICEDNKTFSNDISNEITKLMINTKEEYFLNVFEGYNKELKNKIKQNNRKIYILDIELPKKSGLEIAREIRETDWESIIIIVSAHTELQYEVFKNRLMILDFISKFTNYKRTLKKTLETAIKVINKRKVLEITCNYIKYRISLKNIIYIEKKLGENKVIIKTTQSKYEVSKNLKEIKRQLDIRFYQTHRAMIINKDFITMVDYINNVITFQGGENTTLLSKNYKKGLKDDV